MEVDEVPEIVVGCLALGNFVVWFWLHGVHYRRELLVCSAVAFIEYNVGLAKIRKLDSILDEEDRDVVAHYIPIAFVGVELDCETSYIPHRIGASSASLNCREAYEDRCIPACIRENTRMGKIRNALVQFEVSKCACASSMNDSLRNAFVVEAGDLI